MTNPYDQIRTVFIGGCPRSGTTLLGAMLGAAPRCVATPESQFKQSIPSDLKVDWKRGLGRDDFQRALKKNFRFKLWGIHPPHSGGAGEMNPQEYREAILSLIDVYALKEGMTDWGVWIDHTPENILEPLTIMKIFPEAKFIHIIRDPRAVAASILKLDWGPDSAGHAARFWAEKLSYGQALELAYPDQCMRVHFEDIVKSPEETLRSVCDFCGIEFVEGILSGGGFRPPAYTKRQHKLIGSGPDPGRLDAWRSRLDPWEIQDIENIIGGLMEISGYSRSSLVKLSGRPWNRRLVQRLRPFMTYLRKKRHQFRKKYYGRIRLARNSPSKVSHIEKT
jgi:hypothetical protein